MSPAETANNISTLLGFVVAASIAIWVGIDADKHKMNAGLWGLGTFFCCMIVLPIYLFARQSAGPPVKLDLSGEPTAIRLAYCSNCGREADSVAKFCTSCGNSLNQETR